MSHVARLRTPFLLGAILALAVMPNLGCGSSGGGGGGTSTSVSANCGCKVGGAVGIGGSTPVGPGGGMSGAEIALIEEVFAQVNAERVDRGLNPLAWHNVASDVAWAHTLYQVSINAITHDGPGACVAPTDCLGQRLTNGGIGPGARSAWGENVARGQQTAQEVMCGGVSWMQSQGHCDNILEPTFTHVGMAVKTGDPNGPYWTQVFLRIP